MSLRTHLHRHIAKHLIRHHHHVYHIYHALIHHLNTIEHSALCIVLAVGFVTTSLRAGASTPTLTPNTSLVYPLRQVSTLPCRALLKHRTELDPACKINLPHITNADYASFRTAKIEKDTPFTSVYTTLRGSTYNDGRDRMGDHPGDDIATAKGTPVSAIAHGLITYAGAQAGYGNVVKLMFSIGGTTYHAVYGHLDTVMVSK